MLVSKVRPLETACYDWARPVFTFVFNYVSKRTDIRLHQEEEKRYHNDLRKRVCILYSGLYIEIDQGKVIKDQIKVALL